MLYHLEVNKPFPIPNPSPNTENVRPVLVGKSFDVHYFINSPTPKDIKTFRSNDLYFNIYIELNIPIISIYYSSSNWSFDLNINFLKEPENIRELFLQEGNAINLFLVDAKTNILYVIRTIGMYHEGMNAIKQACADQLKYYNNYTEVEKEIDRLLSQNTTADFIKKSQYKYIFRK